jgi:hypothetical protein
MSIPQEFLDALPSSEKAAELADVDDVFGWMVGSWEVEAILHDEDGQTHETKGEVHAAWVLEGRAIQDLFIFPRRADRHSGRPAKGDRYGTTIKTYDAKLKMWLLTFINPASQETNAQLTARRIGKNIEIEGKLADGTPVRWRYRDVTPTSFHYTAEKLRSDAMSWQLYLELIGRRSRNQAQAA